VTDSKTLRSLRTELQPLGIEASYNRDTEEFRINFRGGKEATAYYTNDVDDALGTGRAMAKEGQRPAPVAELVSKNCMCEHSCHFNNEPNNAGQTTHHYMEEVAVTTVKTAFGAFDVCQQCADVCLKNYKED
jgi:hypothetical protein